MVSAFNVVLGSPTAAHFLIDFVKAILFLVSLGLSSFFFLEMVATPAILLIRVLLGGSHLVHRVNLWLVLLHIRLRLHLRLLVREHLWLSLRHVCLVLHKLLHGGVLVLAVVIHVVVLHSWELL